MLGALVHRSHGAHSHFQSIWSLSDMKKIRGKSGILFKKLIGSQIDGDGLNWALCNVAETEWNALSSKDANQVWTSKLVNSIQNMTDEKNDILEQEHTFHEVNEWNAPQMLLKSRAKIDGNAHVLNIQEVKVRRKSEMIC